MNIDKIQMASDDDRRFPLPLSPGRGNPPSRKPPTPPSKIRVAESDGEWEDLKKGNPPAAPPPTPPQQVERQTFSNCLGLAGLIGGEMLALNDGNPAPPDPPLPDWEELGHPPLSPPPIPPLPKKN